MCQGLAGGSGVGRGLARSSEIGELGGGLLVLVLYILGDGACREERLVSVLSAEKEYSLDKKERQQKKKEAYSYRWPPS